MNTPCAPSPYCGECGKAHTPGQRFYVDVVSGSRFALLLGPYDTHEEATANVERGKQLAVERDPRTWFDSFGTCSTHDDRKTVFGK